jgi:aspartate kinase
MKVFKFGGASVNSAAAIKNVAKILQLYRDEKLIVIFSAMGKTTNSLEAVVDSAFYAKPDLIDKINVVEQYHRQILRALFMGENDPVFYLLDGLISTITRYCAETDFLYDEFYDRIVPFGEFLSTTIISAWFDEIGLKNILVPAPSLIQTNTRFRDAAVDWNKTPERICAFVDATFNENPGHMIITQGFIGGTQDGRRTTLGREGSDFTASVFAYSLNAESVVVWKDVEGLLNADPVYFEDTQKIAQLSYRETIELAFYGAKILHPKTIKPLQNKNIPLHIKSFSNPEGSGSVIHSNEESDHILPFLILKKDQMLLSFSARDFSFITVENLHRLFGVFHDLNIKINLMQNSAISFTICINNPAQKLGLIQDRLKDDFEIRYNDGLELLTIRHFTAEIVDKHLCACKIYLEQRSRKTIQIAYKRG